MGKTFEGKMVTQSFLNGYSTTTIDPYHFVRLSCTAAQIHTMRLATSADITLGITQEKTNPGVYGSVCIAGVSRLKVGAAALTMAVTTANLVKPTSVGHGQRVSATTELTKATMLANAAASDITTVILSHDCARRKI